MYRLKVKFCRFLPHPVINSFVNCICQRKVMINCFSQDIKFVKVTDLCKI